MRAMPGRWGRTTIGAMADAVPMTDPPAPRADGPRAWLAEIVAVDEAVYAAVGAVPTPRLDRVMRRVSTAANYSRLWMAEALLLSAAAGPRGRRAAVTGLASIAASSAAVNLVAKPLAGRARPNRDRREDGPAPAARQVRMPRSRSFPSGHAASAVAFASGAARVLPQAGIPLRTMAALVAYSRVHTGVHYPADVVAGAVIGSACADVVASAIAGRA
jgi:membrane-associated phospholipid phosphatase